MTTRREQILGRIVQTLAGTALVGSRIYRSRFEPFARDEFPAIVVEPTSDSADQTTIATLDWTLSVRVTVFVRGAVPDSLADPIVSDVHSKIMSDPTLQGYAIDILPTSVAFEMTEGDQPIGVIACDFVVRYRTNLNSVSG
jgi:hypothetical protein